MEYQEYAQSSTRSTQNSLCIGAVITSNTERDLFICSFLHVGPLVDILSSCPTEKTEPKSHQMTCSRGLEPRVGGLPVLWGKRKMEKAVAVGGSFALGALWELYSGHAGTSPCL